MPNSSEMTRTLATEPAGLICITFAGSSRFAVRSAIDVELVRADVTHDVPRLGVRILRILDFHLPSSTLPSCARP